MSVDISKLSVSELESLIASAQSAIAAAPKAPSNAAEILAAQEQREKDIARLNKAWDNTISPMMAQAYAEGFTLTVTGWGRVDGTPTPASTPAPAKAAPKAAASKPKAAKAASAAKATSKTAASKVKITVLNPGQNPPADDTASKAPEVSFDGVVWHEVKAFCKAYDVPGDDWHMRRIGRWAANTGTTLHARAYQVYTPGNATVPNNFATFQFTWDRV